MVVRTLVRPEAEAAIREEAIAIAPAPSPGPARGRWDLTHYRCPDCLQPCRCSGDARLLPHNRCGLAAERN